MTSAVPPELPGLTYLEPIGTGGFADVYLYQQALPARRVAVKVLRESGDSAGMAQFHAEANVMAQLSGHPSIVPIHHADVSPDGRAYLVMEYCPPPHLAARYRTERLPVPEVLELAVKIASAVETAHRVGILHRDIKPHNILTSAYGSPLLTDFGIAAVAGEAEGSNYAMSVPWSPPEAFEDPAPLDVRSDVFALAATVYSLLAGRSPFEVPGAANDSATLIHRIERQAPSRILRADVPDSLNELLLRCLSKSLDDRPPSAMAFARAVQEVQIELHLPPTRLEVMDASPAAAESTRTAVDDDRTRVRPVQIIVPDEIVRQGTRLRPVQVDQPDDRTRLRGGREPAAKTVHKKPVVSVQATPPVALEPAPGPLSGDTIRQTLGSRKGLLAGAVLGLLVAIVVVVALVKGESAPPTDTGPTPQRPDPSDVIVANPAQPTNLVARRAGGQIRFTWRNPDPVDGDAYQVSTGPSLQRLSPTSKRVTTPSYAIAWPAGKQLCIQVFTVRKGATSQNLSDCPEVR